MVIYLYTLHIVLTKETGSVQFASCNCKAGLSGVCSHVGGLLFTVVKIKNSCTYLYRVLLTKFHGIIALPSLINICIGFD
jgi:hypothetical protein